MNEQKIAVKYCDGLLLPEVRTPAGAGYSMAFISEMMAYGYIPSDKLATELGLLGSEDIASLYKAVIPVLKESVGAHVKHKPFYPNFPKQVMEASDAELYANALAHYWTYGVWKPEFEIEDRPVAFENVKFKTLDVVTKDNFNSVFTQILKSADSISGFSKEVVQWFITTDRVSGFPEIPFKENLCLVAGELIKQDKWSTTLVKNTTDVLRIATHLSGGDISLAANTKFKSLPRKVRKALIVDLERVAKEEDFVMHRGKWVKLLHNLHVGEYSQKLYDIAKKLRENEKIATFNSKLEEAFAYGDVELQVKLAQTRPGIFARNIARMLTDAKKAADRQLIVNSFSGVVDQVPSRNLTQLWGSLKTRVEDVDKRVVFPKGLVQSAYVLRNTLARIPKKYVKIVINDIQATLEDRFGSLEELGNVYIDPALYECPLPTAMRSASEGLKEVARGTRMPIGDKDVLRFFIYWKGQDIDLSASFHDENFNLVGQVAYYDLRAGDYGHHSGDITRAPHGASEFIDIHCEKALKANKGVRYIAMNVMVYSGPTFAEHSECFAGWMTRDKVNSNEIFEPKTVEQKIDVRSETKNVIPVIFDLVERKAIWADISTNGKRFNTDASKNWGRSGNNVENNKATISDMIEAFTSLDNKVTLGELFEVHAQARGTIVTDRDEADFVFGMSEGDVTPYDVTDINADYL